MRRLNFLLVTLFLLAFASVSQAQTPAPAAGNAAKPMKKDEVFFSLGRQINSVNESPVSALVVELDGLIEVTDVTMDKDGRAIATIKERAPSNASSTQKSTRLKFAPPPTGSDKWTWVEFEENRKFYPVEKLFPYVQDELNKRKLMTDAKWAAFQAATTKQAEAAGKLLDTAKAVIRAEPPPQPAVANARKMLAEAAKENRTEDILTAYRALNEQTEPLNTLGDSFSELKANDAYLRLVDEFKNTVNITIATRRDYVMSVRAYNEALVRLPFVLAAFGLKFQKIEANIEE